MTLKAYHREERFFQENLLKFSKNSDILLSEPKPVPFLPLPSQQDGSVTPYRVRQAHTALLQALELEAYLPGTCRTSISISRPLPSGLFQLGVART